MKLYLLFQSVFQMALAVSGAHCATFSNTRAPMTSGAQTVLSTTRRLSMPGFLLDFGVPNRSWEGEHWWLSSPALDSHQLKNKPFREELKTFWPKVDPLDTDA